MDLLIFVLSFVLSTVKSSPITKLSLVLVLLLVALLALAWANINNSTFDHSLFLYEFGIDIRTKQIKSAKQTRAACNLDAVHTCSQLYLYLGHTAHTWPTSTMVADFGHVDCGWPWPKSASKNFQILFFLNNFLKRNFVDVMTDVTSAILSTWLRSAYTELII